MSMRKTTLSLTAPRARAVSYAMGAYKVLVEGVVIDALVRTHWISNQNL